MNQPVRPNCAGHLPFTCRHFLFGASAAAGASLLTAHADAEVTTGGRAALRGSARCVVFFNLNGGASQLDTFDPKDGPWNPRDADLRQSGPFVISNKYFPLLTKHLNDTVILRSCTSWEAAHERGQFYMQTGHSQNPALAAETPHIGAVIAREKGAAGLLPAFFCFNQTSLQGATFLGGLNQPMMPPASRGGITTLQHNFFGTAQQSKDRFDKRFALLEALDAPLRGEPYNDAM